MNPNANIHRVYEFDKQEDIFEAGGCEWGIDGYIEYDSEIPEPAWAIPDWSANFNLHVICLNDSRFVVEVSDNMMRLFEMSGDGEVGIIASYDIPEFYYEDYIEESNPFGTYLRLDFMDGLADFIDENF